MTWSGPRSAHCRLTWLDHGARDSLPSFCGPTLPSQPMKMPCDFDPIMHMKGSYVSSFFVASWPVDVVRGLLPEGVALARQVVTKDGMHPVFFGFGQQINATLTYFEWLPFFPLNYLEFFIGIPAVRRNQHGILPYDEPYMFLARLYLNEVIPVLGGALFWGFPKELARIKKQEGLYEVETLRTDSPLISLASTPTGPFIAAENSQSFSFLGGLLGQRLLQKSLEGHGPLASASMKWYLANAQIRPIEAQMTISTAFLPGLPTGTFASLGIDQSPTGAFELRSNWRLSLPFPPGSPSCLG